MMLKEYNGKKKSGIVLFHFLLLLDLKGIMLGGSKSKLAKHGENSEKVMSGLFFLEGVGSALSVEIRSYSLCFPTKRYNPACLINFC